MFVFKRELVAEEEKKEVEEVMFNSNLISPGTTFMRNLVKYMKKKFKILLKKKQLDFLKLVLLEHFSIHSFKDNFGF